MNKKWFEFAIVLVVLTALTIIGCKADSKPDVKIVEEKISADITYTLQAAEVDMGLSGIKLKNAPKESGSTWIGKATFASSGVSFDENIAVNISPDANTITWWYIDRPDDKFDVFLGGTNDGIANDNRTNDNGKTVSKKSKSSRTVDLWFEATENNDYEKVLSLFDELTPEDFEWLTTEKAWDREGFSYDLNATGDGVVIKYCFASGEIYTTIIVPKIIEGYPVVAIERFINPHQTNFMTVVLPNTVKEISGSPTFGCIFGSYLTKINMPTSLEKLDGYAFAGSNLEEEIVLPDSLVDMGYGRTFLYCTKLTSVVFGNGIQYIPDQVFYGCESLTNVTFSDSIKELGNDIFQKSAIVYISLPKNLERLNDSFQWCDSLYTVELPKTLKYIGHYAFKSCSGLSVITIPDDLHTLEWKNQSYSNAFTGCTRLTLATRKRLQELGYQGAF
jgi:hypothetical protein